jgi:hypothetical protein
MELSPYMAAVRAKLLLFIPAAGMAVFDVEGRLLLARHRRGRPVDRRTTAAQRSRTSGSADATRTPANRPSRSSEVDEEQDPDEHDNDSCCDPPGVVYDDRRRSQDETQNDQHLARGFDVAAS